MTQAATITLSNPNFDDATQGNWVTSLVWGDAVGNEPGSGPSGDFSNTAPNHLDLTWVDSAQSYAYLKQPTTQTMAAGDTYSLSYYLGGRLDAVSIAFTDVTASLYDVTTGDVLNSQTTLKGSLPIGSMTQHTLTYVVPNGASFIGDPIGIRFESAGTSPYAWSQTAIDTVSLGVSHVPEPASVVLLATAIVSLVCYAWRKRK
jgi:hypothetical protein